MELFRPTGRREMELVAETGWRAWPPRLPDQPIFYPVLTFDYAEKTARDWNSKGAPPENEGFVLRFRIAEDLAQYPVQEAGGAAHRELWVPAEELDAFNDGIVGLIECVAAYRDGARLDLGASDGDT